MSADVDVVDRDRIGRKRLLLLLLLLQLLARLVPRGLLGHEPNVSTPHKPIAEAENLNKYDDKN